SSCGASVVGLAYRSPLFVVMPWTDGFHDLPSIVTPHITALTAHSSSDHRNRPSATSTSIMHCAGIHQLTKYESTLAAVRSMIGECCVPVGFLRDEWADSCRRYCRRHRFDWGHHGHGRG